MAKKVKRKCDESTTKLACSAGVFLWARNLLTKAPCWNSPMRGGEMGRVKGSGEGAGREKRKPKICLQCKLLQNSQNLFSDSWYKKVWYACTYPLLLIGQKQLENWPDTKAKRLQKLGNRALVKRLVGQTTVNKFHVQRNFCLRAKVAPTTHFWGPDTVFQERAK